MRTVIFKSCFKDDMQSFMEYRVATFAWNTYRLDNYRLSSFDRYLTKISYNDEIVPQTIINQWLNDVGVPEASINGYIKTIPINEQIQNIAQKKDTLCRRMYN